jgi:mannosyltransferase
MMAVDFSFVAVVAPNLHRRYSGVTSTIQTLVPRQADLLKSEGIAIAGFGPGLGGDIPKIRLSDLLLGGWSRPRGAPVRVWHARRNVEMLAGIVLKLVLRQPWKLVFTSAGQRRHKAYTRWLIRRMDRVIATSEAAASFLETPPIVIPHGVDTKRFRPSEDRAAEWRAAGLPGSFGIGAFGRVRPQKGSDLAVEAMIRLAPSYPEATLVLTGLIAPQHAAFASRLKARVAAAGLERRILFLGEQPSDAMPGWFRRVSLYVAPMRHEGFGLTPLEAMASGTAVVATRTGAAPLLVADGETGVLIPPDDLEALVAAIEPFLADPQRAERMGRAGLRKALALHDLDREAAGVNQVYRELWAERQD